MRRGLLAVACVVILAGCQSRYDFSMRPARLSDGTTVKEPTRKQIRDLLVAVNETANEFNFKPIPVDRKEISEKPFTPDDVSSFDDLLRDGDRTLMNYVYVEVVDRKAVLQRAVYRTVLMSVGVKGDKLVVEVVPDFDLDPVGEKVCHSLRSRVSNAIREGYVSVRFTPVVEAY
jgi:hypothetical protein